MAENFYHFGPVVRGSPLQVAFLTQPPEDLRKSNFFNFTIEMKTDNHPVLVEQAKFVEFLNENPNDIRNGIKYRIKFKYASGMEDTKFLYLTLVDASTYEPIRYEGHDDSRKMQRVLLTHEIICTRCSQQKSCGNKSEAPSDPRIMNTGVLQFFLKCNQNCLKGAGNPRDMRRFALAISFEDIIHNRNGIVAMSNKIFVHNNSKHSRKRKRDDDSKLELQPALKASDFIYVHPKVGKEDEDNTYFSIHSREWSQEGVSFRYGSMLLMVTSLIQNVAMTVELPKHLRPGTIFITMCFKDLPVFTFPYDIQNKFFPDSRRTNGFLILRLPEQNKKFSCGPHDKYVFVMEGAQMPNYYCDNAICYTAPVYNDYRPSSCYSHSSSSSVSPNSMSSSLSAGSESPPHPGHHYPHPGCLSSGGSGVQTPPSYITPPGY